MIIVFLMLVMEINSGKVLQHYTFIRVHLDHSQKRWALVSVVFF